MMTLSKSKKFENGQLTFPFPVPPKAGETVEVSHDILWARLPLPYRLDHVNIYFVRDDEGWAVIDTGPAGEASRQAWKTLLSHRLSGEKITKVISTHFHGDHIGMAGWLCENQGVTLFTSEISFLAGNIMAMEKKNVLFGQSREFLQLHGMTKSDAEKAYVQDQQYTHLWTPMPPNFTRLMQGDTHSIGAYKFEILAGEGHAPEMIMFYSADRKLLFAGDQVLASISPNIGVSAARPDDNPLQRYLDSLDALKRNVDPEVTVLPGHKLPFIGLHARCDELGSHHLERCVQIEEACSRDALTVMELLPIMFGNKLDMHQTVAAFAEALAHVNFMVARDTLFSLETGAGVDRVLRYKAR